MGLSQGVCVYDARLMTAEYNCIDTLTISGLYFGAMPSLHEVAEWVCRSYGKYKSDLVSRGFAERELQFLNFVANLACRDYVQLASDMPYTPAHDVVVSEGEIKIERKADTRFNLYAISGTPGKGFVFEITTIDRMHQRTFEFVSTDYREIVQITFDDANEVSKMCRRGENVENLGDLTRYYVKRDIQVPIRAKDVSARVGWLKCYDTVVHGVRCDVSIDFYNTGLKLEEDAAKRVARRAIELGARDAQYSTDAQHSTIAIYLYYVPREHINMLLDMIGGGRFQMYY